MKVKIAGVTIQDVEFMDEPLTSNVPPRGTTIYGFDDGSPWTQKMPKGKYIHGTYIGKNLVVIVDNCGIKLAEIASQIHCPDSEGGKYAAKIKSEINLIVDRLLKFEIS